MIAALLRALLDAQPTLPEQVPEGVTVLRGRWIPAIAGVLSGMNGPAAAVTLGDAIVVHDDVTLTPRLLRHELEHVKQWREHSFAFPFRYAWGHLRHGYYDNPYEVQARAAEHKPPETGGKV